ncbi:hypothetical protein EB796_022316 [Bugula neritina]|uniref:Uncharacterized protein n=1 Tax=Bugula neritina TaxID=10212 RepID=A0A7J7IZL8_BUGNE|nr:hypothetical protein EB796_022316 [Bugula neritina]
MFSRHAPLYGCFLGAFGITFSYGTSVVLTGVTAKIISDSDPRISKLLLKEISAENIRQNLKDYASHPHLAGTPADLQQAEQLKLTWLEQGLDRVDILGYDVLLSYPKDGDPNIISLVKECVYSIRIYEYYDVGRWCDGI